MNNPHPPTLDASVVIPLYKSEGSIPFLVEALDELFKTSDSFEFIFVDDASPDHTKHVLLDCLQHVSFPYVFVAHSRNYGEHNAVLTGYRYARGQYIINIDDDLQNPPSEALRLLVHAREAQLDVVYGCYLQKKHALWRNAGSKVANATASWLLGTNPNTYLSSFRCVSAHVAQSVALYNGPYPYIDGLISNVTTSVGSLPVQHCAREIGGSGYNPRRLIRLWLVILTSFSVMPLRLASLIGVVAFLAALVLSTILAVDFLVNGTVAPGWTSTFCMIMASFGFQSLLLGVFGEYLGRVLLTVSGKPQSCVRDVVESR